MPSKRTSTRRGPSTSPTTRCPTGREEIWRFTPLKRLRGLHDDAAARPATASTSSVEAPDGVHRRARRPVATPRAAVRASCPTDRVSARVWDAAHVGASPSTIPAETELDRADRGHGHRQRRRRRPSPASSLVDAGAHAKATVVVSTSAARRRCADNVEVVVGDGAQLTVVTIQDWADDAVHHSHAARRGRPRRDAQARRRHLRRRRGAPRRHRDVRRPRRLGRDARPLLRRRRPAHRAPAVRRPQRAARPRATSSTRARCRARARTRSGSATC